jgi:dihydroorotate dehydrogenase (NAD+) catalytic subunit
MILRGINFGTVFNASGARGFFGEGYWYQTLWKPLGLNWTGSTLVLKTTTLKARKGNMPLEPDFGPSETFPKCIIVKPLKGVVLNSVGLSGPGVRGLLPYWASFPKSMSPYFVSFMSVDPDLQARIKEARAFFNIMLDWREQLGGNFGLQINLSCPNVGLDPSSLLEEAHTVLTLAARVDVPITVKINALVPVEAAVTISEHKVCDAIVCSNTIPWGKLPEKIDWRGLFGSETSPLAHLGGGGLSGAPLNPIVAEWVHKARMAGLKKPIIAGGGILRPEDADDMLDAGADAVELGSVAILRPWRVRDIINRVRLRTGRR